MKVVPREGERGEYNDLGYEDGSAVDPGNRQLQLDAMRSWLVSGVQFVDRRRRFGGHGRTREMLVVDQPARYGPSARWQTLTAALGRHTVQGGLSKLSPEERRVITLAYLEGRTNRQIAAILGVSVTTVRRRLLGAVERLDAYISYTGTRLLVFVLAVAVFVTSHATRLGHRITSAIGSADKVETVVATLSVGVVTAAAVGGILAFTSQSAPSSKAAPAASARLIHTNDTGLMPFTQTRPQTVPMLSDRAKPVAGGGSKTNPDLMGTSQTAGSRHNGCDGNPTSAPPPVPVGSHSGHPTGAPVTHPGAGGCKA
jgi:DNA-binding CsgD family transcriptional regulator